jgi:hypothetical protein
LDVQVLLKYKNVVRILLILVMAGLFLLILFSIPTQPSFHCEDQFGRVVSCQWEDADPGQMVLEMPEDIKVNISRSVSEYFK